MRPPACPPSASSQASPDASAPTSIDSLPKRPQASLRSRTRGMTRDVNRWLRQLMQRHAPERVSGPVWFPELDVSEGDEAITIRVDLPGVVAQDVHISVDRCGVTVSGQRPQTPHLTHGYRRYERRFGSFRRWIPIPSHAAWDLTQAFLVNGVLEIHIPIPSGEAANGIALHIASNAMQLPVTTGTHIAPCPAAE